MAVGNGSAYGAEQLAHDVSKLVGYAVSTGLVLSLIHI